jgi:hypothetical protein
MKWRYFAPDNDDAKNPMRKLSQAERDDIRTAMITIVTSEASVRCLACVCSASAAYQMASTYTQEDLYHGAYKPVTERFQYYLQDLSKAVGAKQYGIIVADHRGRQDDARLRGHHQKLLYATGDFISKYDLLVEGLFLEPSNLSVGIQFADLVAGSIWRKFERNDTRWYDLVEPAIRRGPAGTVDGYGLVIFPKYNWR